MLQTKLPALVSEKDEDPLFNDDWDAAVPLYDQSIASSKPPITLLVMTVRGNFFFDPTQDELAVADGLLAISVAEIDVDENAGQLSVVSMRSIEPPSRTTNPGIPNAMNPATGGVPPSSKEEALAMREAADPQRLWRLPRGGIKRSLVGQMVKTVVEKGGVGWEVLEALDGIAR